MTGGLVAVAMSGGVDSAVAAALLARAGEPVVGITLRIWPSHRPAEITERFDTCCSPAAAEDARRVAERIGIPHYVLNYEAEFDREVIAYFAAAYCRGETPNPCVACNARLKFGSLLVRAQGWGATRVATGHYARAGWDAGRGRWLLRRGVDPVKDQSYFLYSLTQEQLAAAVFPLGHQTKADTRRLARELQLPVAEKPESQEICFVADDYRAFLRERVPEAARPGPIRDSGGTLRGSHQGVAFYTVGQRRGLQIGSRSPLYVIDIQPERNELVVGEARELFTPAVPVEALNWIAIPGLDTPRRVLVKVRSGQTPVPATLLPEADDALRCLFDEPQRAVAPGQAAVFYDLLDPDLVVGGGTIGRKDSRATPPASGKEG
ncbi:MAG: tRNA 2-thiouridine(34) synthase MnmA [Candidatus Methylomirabilales bacterium]